jgi:hypothetical protein
VSYRLKYAFPWRSIFGTGHFAVLKVYVDHMVGFHFIDFIA